MASSITYPSLLLLTITSLYVSASSCSPCPCLLLSLSLFQLLWETVPSHLSWCSLLSRVMWLNGQTLKPNCWSLARKLLTSNLSMLWFHFLKKKKKMRGNHHIFLRGVLRALNKLIQYMLKVQYLVCNQKMLAINIYHPLLVKITYTSSQIL